MPQKFTEKVGFHMCEVNFRAVIAGVLLFTMITGLRPVQAQTKRYPVIVTPGTPSIWSMEQAHYLLNRLRANNDSIRTKAPTEHDLDPNGVSALRLEALQTT